MILCFINTIIFKLYKEKIEKGLTFLNRVSLNKIQRIIAEECSKNSFRYRIISKKNNEIIFKVKKRNKIYIIKYHKTLAVNKFDYNSFFDLYNKTNAKKAYYITTGVFLQDVYNANYNVFLNRSVVLIDGLRFIVNSKKFYFSKKLYFNNLSFKKYFPKF